MNGYTPFFVLLDLSTVCECRWENVYLDLMNDQKYF